MLVPPPHEKLLTGTVADNVRAPLALGESDANEEAPELVAERPRWSHSCGRRDELEQYSSCPSLACDAMVQPPHPSNACDAGESQADTGGVSSHSDSAQHALEEERCSEVDVVQPGSRHGDANAGCEKRCADDHRPPTLALLQTARSLEIFPPLEVLSCSLCCIIVA